MGDVDLNFDQTAFETQDSGGGDAGEHGSMGPTLAVGRYGERYAGRQPAARRCPLDVTIWRGSLVDDPGPCAAGQERHGHRAC